MSIVTNIKIRTTALWCYYGYIADIFDPVEKVFMAGKCLLRSFCYEVTSYFSCFADDINVLLTLLSEIRYATLHCCSWLLPAKSKIILLDGPKGTSYK